MTDVEALNKFEKVEAARRLHSIVSTEGEISVHEFEQDTGGTEKKREAPQPSRLLLKYDRDQTTTVWAKYSLEDQPTVANKGVFVRNSDAFASLDYITSPEGEISQQIRRLRTSLPFPYAERLARKLEFFLEAAREEGEEWSHSSAASLRKMLTYLETISDFYEPEITVMPEMTFRAQWTANENAHFAVHFLPDGRVSYVIFRTDPRHPNQVQRHSGIVAWDSLAEVIAPYNVEQWAQGD